jgi:hypothetical protein
MFTSSSVYEITSHVMVIMTICTPSPMAMTMPLRQWWRRSPAIERRRRSWASIRATGRGYWAGIRRARPPRAPWSSAVHLKKGGVPKSQRLRLSEAPWEPELRQKVIRQLFRARAELSTDYSYAYVAPILTKLGSVPRSGD